MSEFIVDVEAEIPRLLEASVAAETITAETAANANTFLTLALQKGLATGRESDAENRPAFVALQAGYERLIAETVEKTTQAQLDGAISQQGSDQFMRQSFVQVQGAMEATLAQKLKQENSQVILEAKKAGTRLDIAKLNLTAHALMIIHTPTPATPMVSPGHKTLDDVAENAKHLVSDAVLQDKSRLSVTLQRANILRDYLAAGGIIVVAYEGKRRNDRPLVEFEKLMAEYPAQIIDFPIADEYLEKVGETAQYPLDKIGATYLLSDRAGHICDITNRGVQANDPRDDATWCLAIQDRTARPKPDAQAMVADVMEFLEQAGLASQLKHHFNQHQLNWAQYADLLSEYLRLTPRDIQGHPLWQELTTQDQTQKKTATM